MKRTSAGSQARRPRQPLRSLHGAACAPAALAACAGAALTACLLCLPLPRIRWASPRIKQVVQRTLSLPDQPPIARQGQAFVREQLTMEALHCYWLGALQRYAQIFYLPRTPAQEAAAVGRAGGG